MPNGDLRSKYFEALGVEEDGAGARAVLRSALRRAHDIRKFEIELYWKRATYFWALQGAAFAAFALLWHAAPADTRPIATSFAGVGLLTGCVGWLSARGSKFWQENWEKHIDLLESQFEGHLHKTIWIGPDGVQFSVSRLNQRLSLLLTGFWFVLLVASAWIILALPCWLPAWVIALFGFVTIFGALAWLWCARSKLNGRIYEEGSHDWVPFPRREGRYRILRRLGPGEAA